MARVLELNKDSHYSHIDEAMRHLTKAVHLAVSKGDYYTLRRCASALIAVDPMRGRHNSDDINPFDNLD